VAITPQRAFGSAAFGNALLDYALQNLGEGADHRVIAGGDPANGGKLLEEIAMKLAGVDIIDRLPIRSPMKRAVRAYRAARCSLGQWQICFAFSHVNLLLLSFDYSSMHHCAGVVFHRLGRSPHSGADDEHGAWRPMEHALSGVAQQQPLKQWASMVANHDDVRVPLPGSGYDLLADHAITQNLIAGDVVGPIPQETEQRLGILVKPFDRLRFDESHFVGCDERAANDIYERECCPDLPGQADGRISGTQGRLTIVDRHQNSFE